MLLSSTFLWYYLFCIVLHSYLDTKFITDLLKVRMFTGVWDFHVNAGSHSSSQIGGTRREVSSGIIVLEPKLFVQFIDRQTQPPKDGTDVASLLRKRGAEVRNKGTKWGGVGGRVVHRFHHPSLSLNRANVKCGSSPLAC